MYVLLTEIVRYDRALTAIAIDIGVQQLTINNEPSTETEVVTV